MIITLTTDFGGQDAYVAAMKGVILAINSAVTIVDLCHLVPPQDIREGAFVLHTAWRYFPPGTIHIAVVDPGVGSQRRALLVKTALALFLAPDNGILSFVLAEAGGYQCFTLTNPRYWRHPVSATFHGRDIFAPVAAHLSRGVPAEELGTPASDAVLFPVPRPSRPDTSLIAGEILHIDRFGNIITNIRASDLPSPAITVEIAGHRITGLSTSYYAGEGLLALVGSSDYLEIALKNGSAAQMLAAQVGQPVVVRGSQ